MTTEAHWAVCRTFSNRVHIVRPEIEKTNRGTFLPTYAKVWASDGKFSCRERALMPGYLFLFLSEPSKWAEVKDVYGVFDVLANNGVAGRVRDSEMCRLVLDHITGARNDVNLDGLERQTLRQQRRIGRRPRASKRARAA